MPEKLFVSCTQPWACSICEPSRRTGSAGLCVYFLFFFGNAFALLHILILYVLCTARKLKIWGIKMNFILIFKKNFLRLKLLLSWWHFK